MLVVILLQGKNKINFFETSIPNKEFIMTKLKIIGNLIITVILVIIIDFFASKFFNYNFSIYEDIITGIIAYIGGYIGNYFIIKKK